MSRGTSRVLHDGELANVKQRFDAPHVRIDVASPPYSIHQPSVNLNGKVALIERVSAKNTSNNTVPPVLLKQE